MIITRFFDLEGHGATPQGELRAGATTFLTMAYILFVNPAILATAIHLEGGDTTAQLLSSTAIAAAFGCLMMGIIARYPFALAPGMGLNAYFAFTVVGQAQIPWQTALGAVFISGVLFLILSLTGVRSLIIEAIPRPLRHATTAGIGFFLAFIGLQNAGIVVKHPVTLVTLGDLSAIGPALALLGLLIMGIGAALRLRGAILLGVITVAVISALSGAPVFQGQPFAGLNEGLIRAPIWPTGLIGAMDLGGALGLGLLGVVFIFFFVDLFDTAGTLIGLAERGGLHDKDGNLPRSDRAFTADALATIFGAAMGTSTTTAYIESAAGIEAGGRTGLTAVFVGLFFLLSLFLWPLISAVPAVATAPALILVGALMMSGLRHIDWEAPRVALPAFLTVAAMPLSFSIANGISLGIISWTLLRLTSGRAREVHPILYGLSVALIARYLWLSAG